MLERRDWWLCLRCRTNWRVQYCCPSINSSPYSSSTSSSSESSSWWCNLWRGRCDVFSNNSYFKRFTNITNEINGFYIYDWLSLFLRKSYFKLIHSFIIHSSSIYNTIYLNNNRWSDFRISCQKNSFSSSNITTRYIYCRCWWWYIIKDKNCSCFSSYCSWCICIWVSKYICSSTCCINRSSNISNL